MMKKIHACKILLVSVAIFCSIDVCAQVYAELPEPQIQSTSAMPLSGSLLPQAAATGVNTTYNLYKLNGESDVVLQVDAIQKKSRPGDWDDPFPNPTGDVPWGLMALCVIIYMIKRYHKNKEEKE